MGLEVKLPSVAETREIRFLAAVEDELSRELVSRVVAELGWHNAKVAGGGLADAARAIDPASPPNMLVLDIGDNADPFPLLDSVAEYCPPETRVLCIGTANDVSLYRRLVAIGVGDYLLKPMTGESLREALMHLARPPEQRNALVPHVAQPVKKSKLLAVIGARGGIGTSTVVAGLGWCLAEEQKKRVALVDLDLQFGSLALNLDLEPGRGLREALEHPERIDGLLIAGAMSGTSDNLRVLAAEEALDDQPRLDPSAVDPLIRALGEGFDYVIADVPRALDALSRRFVSKSDRIAIVTEPSLAGMRDAQRLATLVEMLQPGAKPLMLLNRVGMLARGEVPLADFEKGIGRKIDGVLPYETKTAIAMAEQAKPLPALAKSGKAAAELRRLATLMAGIEKPAAVRNFLLRWLGI